MVSPVVASLACVGLVAADMLTRTVRIRRLVTSLGGRLSFGDAVRLNLLGDAAAELTPFRAGGEPSRVGALVQARVPADIAVLAVGVELVLSYGLLALLVGGASWTMLPAWWSSFGPALHRAAGLALFAAFAAAAVAVAWSMRRAGRAGVATPGPGIDPGMTAAASAGAEKVRVAGVRSSLAALARIGWRDVSVVFALGIPNTVARVGILWVLVSTLPGAPPAATTLVGSFVLLFGQALAPTPSGVGVVEMGMLGGAAGPLGPHAVSVLVYWRVYTAILPIVLAAVFAVPRFGVRPVLAVLGVRRARAQSPEHREDAPTSRWSRLTARRFSAEAAWASGVSTTSGVAPTAAGTPVTPT